MRFLPDYHNVLSAATNKRPKRIPLYEHIVSESVMQKILHQDFAALLNGPHQDKKEYFKYYTNFFEQMGYDTVSFEQCITKILPGGGALYHHADPVIKTMDDFLAYPWDRLEDDYFNAFQKDYEVLREAMPEGMKAIGGPGNGVFEIVQDLCGYENLCYIAVDDPSLFEMIFAKVAEMMFGIWQRFLDLFQDVYAVCRFGGDLGFRSQTLLSEKDIKLRLIPAYSKIVALIHSYDKPFLLHSCGQIFSVMDDLIDKVKIDAKHSNEDAIAPFDAWVSRYGAKIGNFGGVDTDVLCSLNGQGIREYVIKVYSQNAGKNGGIAFGSGNSIPEYIPAEGYLAMVNTLRELRGDQ